MMHFSCDLCGQSLKEDRYVVKIEVFPAHNAHEITDADLDVDQLDAISDLLNQLDNPEEIAADTGLSPQYFRYDLCSDCRRRFQEDPLGREAVRRLNFSQN